MSHCPICHSSNFDAFAKIDHGTWTSDRRSNLIRDRHIYPIGQCRTCGHVMITKDYDQDDFNRLYLFAPQGAVYWSEEFIGSTVPYQNMASLLGEKQLKESNVIVDFGCGPGELLNTLHQIYGIPESHLYGMDFNSRISNPHINYHETDLNNLSQALDRFGNKKINIGFASHVFEHLIDPAQFLSDLRPHMSRDGVFFIEVPDFSAQTDEQAGRASLVNAQHIHYFAEDSLTSLIEKSGWAVHKIKHMTTGYIPRLQAVITPDGKTTHIQHMENSARNGVLTNLNGMKTYRERLLHSVQKHIQQGDTPALWGIGAEMDRMMIEHPELLKLIKSNAVTLYDLGSAGHTLHGAPIFHPDELPHHKGPVIIIPMVGDVTHKMKKVAEKMGIEVIAL